MSVAAFADAMRAAGIRPPDVIDADGRLHRFSTNDKRDDDAGWYVLHDDSTPVGQFGDWRTGAEITWRGANGRPLTPAEESAQRKRIAAAKRERDLEEHRRHAAARERAAEIWKAAAPAPDAHPYLIRKGVRAHGLRVHEGRLVIPMRDAARVLHSLQFVDADGEKRFLPGGRKRGCYFAISGEPTSLICIAEGYATGATVHEATGHAVAIAFDAGNLLPVATALRSKRPKARIVLAADDDARTEGNPGRTKATEAANAVGGVVVLPEFGVNRPGDASDFNDLAHHRGPETVAASFRAGTDLKAFDIPNTADALPYVWASAVSDAHAPDEIVETTLSAYAMSVIYGESGSGKTFVALDLACRQSLGWPWLGRRTRRGLVVYAAAEAGATIHNRVKAFKDRHGVEDLPVALITCPINLLDRDADVDRLIAMIRQINAQHDETVTLIIVDTLSRAMAGGDENSPEDMGALVRNSDRIRERTRAHVLWVHHAGKDLTRGARGHSLLRAAVDTELECVNDDGAVRIRVTKQRDGPGGVEFAAKLLPVPVGVNSWGDAITSCVVEHAAESGPRRARERKPPKGTGIALQALREALSEHGEPTSRSSVVPGGVRAVTGEMWRRRYETLDPLAAADGSADAVKRADGARRRRFERARASLQDAEIVGGRADSWWLL